MLHIYICNIRCILLFITDGFFFNKEKYGKFDLVSVTANGEEFCSLLWKFAWMLQYRNENLQ